MLEWVDKSSNNYISQPIRVFFKKYPKFADSLVFFSIILISAARSADTKMKGNNSWAILRKEMKKTLEFFLISGIHGCTP